MTEPNWFEIGLAALIAAFGWLFKRHIARVDKIERELVCKKDFDELADTVRAEVNELREDRNRMHGENREDLQYIRERLDSMADRR